MRRATWSKAVTCLGSGLALLLGVTACRAPSPVNAVVEAGPTSPDPHAAPKPTNSASTTVATSAAIARSVDPHAPHPVLLALVRRLSEWSPGLAARLATVSLADTAAADPERAQSHLLHLFARQLLLPTLRLSADPLLLDLAESIEASDLFGAQSAGSTLGMRSDLTPTACHECNDCSNHRRCQQEQRRLAPAFFFEEALGFFDDLCTGEHDFPWSPSCELALERYLDATVAAGLSRRHVEDVSFQIVEDVTQRCRTIEQSPALDPNHPLEATQILEQAHVRWRALYGTLLPGKPLVVTGTVRSTESSADAEAAMRRFECRMYREVPTMRRYARQLETYYAAELAREKSDDESSDEPLESPYLDCYERRGPAARRCHQVHGGTNGVRSALGDQLEASPPPAELITQLALALESLSLAGISPRVIDEQYRLLARTLTSEPKGK